MNLENGELHYIKDIPAKTNLNLSKVEYVTKFLVKYNLIQLDERQEKVKLDPLAKRVLNKIRKLEAIENQ